MASGLKGGSSVTLGFSASRCFLCIINSAADGRSDVLICLVASPSPASASGWPRADASPTLLQPFFVSGRFRHGFNNPSGAEGFVGPEVKAIGDAGLLRNPVNEFEGLEGVIFPRFAGGEDF